MIIALLLGSARASHTGVPTLLLKVKAAPDARAELRVVVRDSLTRRPLRDAIVWFFGSTLVRTDGRGRARIVFEPTTEGRFSPFPWRPFLLIRHEGYRMHSWHTEPRPGKRSKVVIDLVPLGAIDVFVRAIEDGRPLPSRVGGRSYQAGRPVDSTGRVRFSELDWRERHVWTVRSVGYRDSVISSHARPGRVDTVRVALRKVPPPPPPAPEPEWIDDGIITMRLVDRRSGLPITGMRARVVDLLGRAHHAHADSSGEVRIRVMGKGSLDSGDHRMLRIVTGDTLGYRRFEFGLRWWDPPHIEVPLMRRASRARGH